MRFLPSSMSPISIAFAGILVLSPLEGMAAEWLAPAADERISAEWVHDVAKAFKKDRYKNVFMNQPFGCDQCRIIGYLNNAAQALESDQPKLAKSFLRRSLAVLNQGLEDGWYTESDVQTVKRLILRKARQGFQEAGAPKMARAEQGPEKDPRYEHGDEPLFGGPEASDRFPSTADRWGGYTEGSQYGLTERLDRARQGRPSDREPRRESGSARSRPSDESRFERGDRDDMALDNRARRGFQERSDQQAASVEQEGDQRKSRDRSHRRGRASFPEDMTAEDALNALMQDDQEESS